jgi:trk system potassium uptake protein TrkA
VGASELTVYTATRLIEKGHAVIIIEEERARIDALYDELDCGFLHGDGTRPAILREADPPVSDALYCLTGSDQTNILASVVGRSVGFPRVVTALSDPELETVCVELGLEGAIVPNRALSRELADMLRGEQPLEMSPHLRHEARLFEFRARDEEAGLSPAELALPGDSAVMCVYRDGSLHIASDRTRLRPDDEVVILTREDHLPPLRDRWPGTRTAL